MMFNRSYIYLLMLIYPNFIVIIIYVMFYSIIKVCTPSKPGLCVHVCVHVCVRVTSVDHTDC